jgi:hypothetical protein
MLEKGMESEILEVVSHLKNLVCCSFLLMCAVHAVISYEKCFGFLTHSLWGDRGRSMQDIKKGEG